MTAACHAHTLCRLLSALSASLNSRDNQERRLLLRTMCQQGMCLVAATRRDLATKTHFRVQHCDAWQGVLEHPALPRCDAKNTGEYPL
eukprot:1140430-Pelagomonas_calceolata.AAC.4